MDGIRSQSTPCILILRSGGICTGSWFHHLSLAHYGMELGLFECILKDKLELSINQWQLTLCLHGTFCLHGMIWTRSRRLHRTVLELIWNGSKIGSVKKQVQLTGCVWHHSRPVQEHLRISFTYLHGILSGVPGWSCYCKIINLFFSFRHHNKHLMTSPKGNSDFCFPKTLMHCSPKQKPRGTLTEGRGERNLQFLQGL